MDKILSTQLTSAVASGLAVQISELWSKLLKGGLYRDYIGEYYRAY